MIEVDRRPIWPSKKGSSFWTLNSVSKLVTIKLERPAEPALVHCVESIVLRRFCVTTHVVCHGVAYSDADR